MSADPITFLAQLAYNNGAGINVTLPQISAPVSTTITGVNFTENTMTVPTTSTGTAIPLGGLGNLGLAMFINLDPTNYVEIMTAVSGTKIIKMLPGDYALFRFDPSITAPAAIAHTAAVQLQYLILEN
jgi:hypothetical protein